MHTVQPLKEHERRFSGVCHDGTEYDTMTAIQNTEIGDHYRVELFLDRWRTAAELEKYLKWVADQVMLLEQKRIGKRT